MRKLHVKIGTKIDPKMNRSPKIRVLAALMALVSMLFMQLAVAAYACPNLRQAKHGAGTTMAMSPGCKGMDMEQPSLCHAHDQVDNQSLDKPQVPLVQAFVPVTLVQAVFSSDAVYFPELLQARTLYLTRATDPPLSIQHCCFRI